MRKSLPLLLLLYFLPTSAYPQAAAASQSLNAASHHRNNQAEDAVANLFDTVRKDAKLHRLGRIRDRKELQQLVCTVSLSNKIPRFANGSQVLNSSLADNPSALYETANPGEITPHLQQVALFERPRGRSGQPTGYRRYSVAVWPTRQEKDGKPSYWVGIKLFWSAGNEFFLNHFSDAKEWKNEWEKFVAPECKKVK